MTATPGYSVVLTTYDGARWIQPQLDSIAAQSQPPSELVVCDDGSSDDTLGQVAGFAARVEFPVVVLSAADRAPLGTVVNLQRGLAAAACEHIMLCDQDDIWREDHAGVLLQHLGVTGVEMVFSDGAIIDQHGQRMPGSLWSRAGFTPGLQDLWLRDPIAVLARRHVVTGATMALSRRARDWALPITSPGWHDAWIAVITAALGGRVVGVPELLVDYRIHDGNQTNLIAKPGAVGWLSTVRREGAGYAQFAGQFRAAAERAQALGADSDTVVRLAEIAKLWARRGRTGSRPRRLVEITRLGLMGDYRRHATGWRSMVVDAVVDPAVLTREQAQASLALPAETGSSGEVA